MDWYTSNWDHLIKISVRHHARANHKFFKHLHIDSYEAVSDQGPVWVRGEDEILGGFKWTPGIIFPSPLSSLVIKLSEKVWHIYRQIECFLRLMCLNQKNFPFLSKSLKVFLNDSCKIAHFSLKTSLSRKIDILRK